MLLPKPSQMHLEDKRKNTVGEFIKKFTFDRNTLKLTPLASALEAEKHITLALQGTDLGSEKAAYNIVTALQNYTGVLEDKSNLTPVGERFLRLYSKNKEDAWRWLITRSLWLYVVPNGTAAKINSEARNQGKEFAFFRTVIGLLTHLAANEGVGRFLFYEELCELLNDDANWTRDTAVLYQKIMAIRAGGVRGPSQRSFLGDLENTYGISKDNLNTVINKAFDQTGLFDYYKVGTRLTGIALSTNLDPVLQRRIRVILDTPVTFRGEKAEDWAEFLQTPPTDLPEEVSFAPSGDQIEAQLPEKELGDLISEARLAFDSAGLHISEHLIRRFAASLLAKRFVILTGLSGSGKTKLAQAFAQWITPKTAGPLHVFSRGQALSAEDRRFDVGEVGTDSVQLIDDGGQRVAISLEMIQQAAGTIELRGFNEETSAAEIAAALKEDYSYSDALLNALSVPIKAAVFANLDAPTDATTSRYYEVVSVGADWSGKESILGYPDAITSDRYVRATPTVDLILRAAADSQRPYFLILDEMNLSHVERYFADFLSVIESGENLQFHSAGNMLDGVPAAIKLPENLFVIGTVNVDETTYTFSPKVLDRANSIEFRADSEQMLDYLGNPSAVGLSSIEGKGRGFARVFAAAAKRNDATPSQVPRFQAEMALLFDVLSSHGAEFGFRTAKEVARFIHFHELLSSQDWNFDGALDAQICQKILPKLHGSQRKLEPVLRALAILCWHPHEWLETPAAKMANAEFLKDVAAKAASLSDDALNPLSDGFPGGATALDAKAHYPISFDKIRRMLVRLASDGFTSFAEA
jgi:hypothetical protein